ncbi:protein containing tetratricopeptide (TPR) repeat [Psychromonas ingrahamii 37]|uniref:Protein containing tetratricopeptide (TPR) repeat n=1 Tax=Psychromonas ingrahamii (strain DSM 17664 / CCUG 51855 / 37) TaxID=357804 RepID=A1SWN8_PSYIN|nr:tetratricopeptide repeat protein [Psychromonas ingrahamii]ABM03903.1 protein containing tetratricopeptide (TPR) repeat [Psychromonas ingrahamii 37]
MNFFNKCAVLCLPWILVACSTIPTQPIDKTKQPAVIETPREPVQLAPQEVPVDSAASAPSAVIYLLKRAEQQEKNGDRQAAASSLERAIRMAPRFPESYYRLGELRYQEAAYNQATSLAQKALRLGAEGILRRQAQDLVKKAGAY